MVCSGATPVKFQYAYSTPPSPLAKVCEYPAVEPIEIPNLCGTKLDDPYAPEPPTQIALY